MVCSSYSKGHSLRIITPTSFYKNHHHKISISKHDPSMSIMQITYHYENPQYM